MRMVLLGPVDVVRFLQQFDTGRGDYTEERKRWLNGMSLDDIMEGIEEERKLVIKEIISKRTREGAKS